MNKKVKKIVIAALLAALCCSFTFIYLPLPIGYANLGDMMVLLSAVMLGPLYGALAAGIGTALADLFMGYPQYIPATFVIKALVALVCVILYKAIRGKKNNVFAFALSGIVAESIMVCGYYLYEAVVLAYGFGGAAVSVFGNCLQGCVGVILATLLLLPVLKLFNKIGK